MTVRVLVAEDQGLVRSGLCHIINHQAGLAVVAEAADGEQAVAAALGHRPDAPTCRSCAGTRSRSARESPTSTRPATR